MEPDEQDGLARHDGLGDQLGGLERQALVDEGRRDARVARDLDVVAGGMAVGRADQPLERSRVAWRRPAPRALPRPDAARACTTRRRLRRACAARPGVSRYQSSPTSSASP